MKVEGTNLNGVILLKPQVFRDHRGFFVESYSQRVLAEAGIDTVFVQDNHSLSVEKGVLRGLHFQIPPRAQTKLVRVIRGAVYDVVVDLRRESPTYLKWEGFELTAEDFRMLYVPKGFAHGFCTLAENTEFTYKNDDFYAPEAEGGIRWNDPGLSIKWPVEEPILSKRDSQLPLLADFNSPF